MTRPPYEKKFLWRWIPCLILSLLIHIKSMPLVLCASTVSIPCFQHMARLFTIGNACCWKRSSLFSIQWHVLLHCCLHFFLTFTEIRIIAFLNAFLFSPPQVNTNRQSFFKLPRPYIIFQFSCKWHLLSDSHAPSRLFGCACLQEIRRWRWRKIPRASYWSLDGLRPYRPILTHC